MAISLDEVLGLFNKWLTERTALMGISTSTGLSVIFLGVFTRYDSESCRLSATADGVGPLNVFIFPRHVVDFEYQDVHEAPEQARDLLMGRGVVAVLIARFPTSTLALYEMESTKGDI